VAWLSSGIEGHGVSCNCREDLLVPFIERFFAERVFGPMRLDLLTKQLDKQERAQAKQGKRQAKELRATIAKADADIKAATRGLLAGVEPQAVQALIDELKAEKATANTSLAALVIDPAGDDDLPATLDRLPDLTEALQAADPDAKRQFFDAFDLRVVFDKLDQRISISATVTEAVADMLQNPGGLALCGPEAPGVGLEPTTLRLTAECSAN
jgi:site-specific DNA recombinase